MALLTFTSDFGHRDHYVAAVKGSILSQLSDVTIVDISHEVKAFNISEAAYLVRNAYRYFPKGTVHLIGVKSEASPENPHRLVVYEGHYFVAADTGIFRLMFKKEPDAVYDLHLASSSDVLTFPVLHVLVNAVCHLLRGGTPEVIGKKGSIIREAHQGKVYKDQDTIKGHVIHVDRYDNLITDIPQRVFNEVGLGRKFKVLLRTHKYKVKKISTHYSDGKSGDVVALFNTDGYLEIAIRDGAPDAGGGAAQLLGLDSSDLIVIVFESDEKSLDSGFERTSSETMIS